MTPLGHTGISLLAGIGLTKIAPTVDTIAILTAMVVGGNILDTDHLYRVSKLGLKAFGKTIGKHRFFPSHTPFTVLTITSIVAIFSLQWAIIFGLGCSLHLFLDTLFFPEGINFGYPFSKARTKFLSVRAGSFWTPKSVVETDDWLKNYLPSPLFWVAEALPTAVAFVLLLRLA